MKFGNDAGPFTAGTALTRSAKVLVTRSPIESVTVALTLYVFATVGVPVIAPLIGSSDSPGGSPVADQPYPPVPPLAVRTELGYRRFTVHARSEAVSSESGTAGGVPIVVAPVPPPVHAAPRATIDFAAMVPLWRLTNEYGA